MQVGCGAAQISSRHAPRLVRPMPIVYRRLAYCNTGVRRLPARTASKPGSAAGERNLAKVEYQRVSLIGIVDFNNIFFPDRVDWGSGRYISPPLLSRKPLEERASGGELMSVALNA